MSRSSQSRGVSLDDEPFLTYLRGLVGRTLHTLDYKRPFTVDGVEKDRINITTSKGNPRAVTLQGTILAHKHLVAKGELTRGAIRTLYSDLNPAYIAPILASLDYVDFTLRPIRLFLVNK